MTRDEIFHMIDVERCEQGEKWNVEHPWGFGDCSSLEVLPIVKAAVLSEEAGEVARAVLDQNDAALKLELVQVAAVAVAWLESM